MTKQDDYIFSPPGIAVWPKLNEPDYKYKTEEGEFTVKLRLDPTDSAAFEWLEELKNRYEDEFTQAVDDAAKKKKKVKRGPVPWTNETNDEDEETGMVLVKFGMKYRTTTKKGRIWERKPELYNAQLEPMEDMIGGGSLIIVKTDPYFWNTPGLGFGLSLQPLAVQVLELRQSESVGSTGFTAVAAPVMADAEAPADDGGEY